MDFLKLSGSSRIPPLAERLRPKRFEDFIGMEKLLAPSGLLKKWLDAPVFPSLLLWGPPGCGKTTLAGLIIQHLPLLHKRFSGARSSISQMRAFMEKGRRDQPVVIFVDEFHRLNKAQQDSFLQPVEEGRVILLATTTENPSFEVTPPLLSRLQVLPLPPLDEEGMQTLLERALDALSTEDKQVTITEEAKNALMSHICGDGRKLLNLMELASQEGGTITKESLERVAQRPLALYDKAGDYHYSLISAFHKSLRNSDPEATLYWLARMLEGGEDPLYIARRIVRAASEDVGMADPRGLTIAVASYQAVHFLGLPEGALALAQAALYIALAPKSHRLYRAYGKAQEVARKTRKEPVPLHLWNAPTRWMEKQGYGKGYQYAHDYPAGVAPMACLPPSLQGEEWYHPSDHGLERWYQKLLRRLREARKNPEGSSPWKKD